jgi:hypothetical protein
MFSAITTRVKNSFHGSACTLRAWLVTLLLFGAGSIASAVEVYLLPVAPVGYETNAVPATMKLVRTSTIGALTVRLSLNAESVAAIGSDYTVSGTGIADTTFSTVDPLDALDSSTSTVTMADGEGEVLITITPADDALVEARESMVFTVKPSNVSSYVIGAPSSMSLTIADNDHKARIQVPDPVADEDSALFGLVSDQNVQRRSVMRVRFDPFAGTPFTRNLAVNFVTVGGTQPIAALTTDYAVHYKICGNSGATAERSRIGYDKVNIRGTGLGYTLIAHLAGETQISMTGSEELDDVLPAGSTLRFSNHSTVYTVASAGPNGVVLTAGLTANLSNGTGITVLSIGGAGTADPPDNLVVQRIYPTGTTTINVDFGSGGLFIGDVFQIDDHDGFYVVTADTASLVTSPTAGASGALTFRRYQGDGTGGGLEKDTGGSPLLTTHIAGAVVGGVMQVLVPEESTKVEISVTPVSDGIAEGAEEVRMRMIADEDYEVLTPQESSIFIADRDISTTISVVSNAGLPSQTGYFKVTFSGPFTRSITVPYLVVDNLTTGPLTNDDYEETIQGSVTLVAGQTEALIQVDPIAARGPASVTLTLIGNLNYKLAGSTSSGVNPSATMDISDSVGAISIAATTPAAGESATAPTNGVFTVSVVRNAGQTGAIGATLAVAGTAVVGSRFEFVSATNTVITPVNNQIQVTVPANQNSVTLGVRPINNFLADGNQIVQLQVIDGPSYLVGTPSTASVTVVDDEPTVSVVRVNHASRPSTPGAFLFSYTGAALSQAVVVNFTYSGTGVRDTDFTAATVVTIPSGNTSQQLAINPIDTPDGLEVDVVVTINPSTTYNIGTNNTATLTIGASDSPAGDKPTPGTINSGSSSGGCGLGSGFATLVGLGMFALLAFRRRQG